MEILTELKVSTISNIEKLGVSNGSSAFGNPQAL